MQEITEISSCTVNDSEPRTVQTRRSSQHKGLLTRKPSTGHTNRLAQSSPLNLPLLLTGNIVRYKQEPEKTLNLK
jgi:hypothetical protein